MHARHVLKALRAIDGTSQGELAAAVGRSHSWLSLVEAGKLVPKGQQAEKLAELLVSRVRQLSALSRRTDRLR